MDPLRAASAGDGDAETSTRTINGNGSSSNAQNSTVQPSTFNFTSWEELRGSQSTANDMETGSEEEEDSLEMHSAEGESESDIQQQHRDGRRYDRLLQVEDGDGERDGGSASDLDEADDDVLLAEPLEQNKQSSSSKSKKQRRRRRRRRVYGGGRRASLHIPNGGERRGILSTSFHLSIASLSPCSLILLPYAYSLTGGLSFGLPITLLLLLLGQYFSHSLLVVEGRYVGSRSYHTLGGAVFPQAPRNLGKYAGQLLVLVFQVLVDGGRTLVALILATQLLTDLSLAAFPRAPAVLHNHVFLALLVGLPLLLSSTAANIARRPLLPLRWTRSLRQIPQYALPLLILPLVILIFGISLKNLDDYPSLTKPGHGYLKLEKPSYSSAPLRTPSLWSGVSIIFLVVGSTHSSTFPLYRALKKRNALPASSSMQRGASATLGLSGGAGNGGTGQTIDGGSISPGLSGGPSSSSGNNNNNTGEGTSFNANSGDGSGSGSGVGGLPSSFLTRHIQSHRFETSSLLSCFLTCILILPFGIIGYLSLLVIRPNVFETLPRNHAGFNTCRVLLVLGILGNIRKVGENAVVAGMRILGIAARAMRSRGGSAGKQGELGAGRKIKKTLSRSNNNNKHKRRNSELELGQVDDYDNEATGSQRDSDNDEDEYSPHPSDVSDASDDEGLGHSYSSSHNGRRNGKRKTKVWIALLSNLAIWGSIIALACTKGKDLSGIAELVGCVGCVTLGFLLPGERCLPLLIRLQRRRERQLS